MGYFQNRKKYVAPSGILHSLKQLILAVSRALRRNSHLIKGRKRLYASSLAFKTVLALVPALAILMAVLSGNAFTQKREQLLDKIVDVIYPVEMTQDPASFGPPEPQDLRKLKETSRKKIHTMVNQFAKHAEKMGFAGFAVFTVILFILLSDVESAFNFLWGVEKNRAFFTQILRCAGLLLILPLLIAGGLALKERVVQWFALKPGGVLSFLGLWFFCFCLYKWIPNAKVRWKPAILAAILAALVLGVARWGINWYVLHVATVSRVYGALWMIPVILVWFYLCWAVILFGSEVTYLIQKQNEESGR